MLTIFSLVQGFKDDPPLRVIETESQLQEGFARTVLKINVDVENKKVELGGVRTSDFQGTNIRCRRTVSESNLRFQMYVPWQTREIVKGKFFKNNEKQVLQLTILKSEYTVGIFAQV